MHHINMHHDHHDHDDSKGRGKRGRNRRIGEETRARYDRFRDGGFGPGHRGAPFGGPGPFGPLGPFGPDGFGPRRRRAKGDVRSAILHLLGGSEGLSGYGLMGEIAARTEGAWRPSPGSVYPTLQLLVDEDLVLGTGAGRSTVYSLTDAGKAYVEEHKEELASAFTSIPRPSGAQTDLGSAIGRLMMVVGQLNSVATDEQRAAATAKVDELRKALYLILAD